MGGSGRLYREYLFCLAMLLPGASALAQDGGSVLIQSPAPSLTSDDARFVQVSDLGPVTLWPSTSGTAPLPLASGLKRIAGTVKSMEQALAAIVHAAGRTEVDVRPNPVVSEFGLGVPYMLGYDPMMLDPLMGYGFDFSLDTEPVVRHDTGRLLPLSKAVLDPLIVQVTNDMTSLLGTVNDTDLPETLSSQAKVQWQVLNDTLQRMQKHILWLKDLAANNSDDNLLIARAALSIHDDASGTSEIARQLLKAEDR